MNTFTKSFTNFTFLLTLSFIISACGNIDLNGTSSGSSSGSSLSAESDQEAIVTAAIESLNSTISSSASASGGALSANLTTGPSTVTTSNLALRGRYRCADVLSVTESFSCDNSDEAASMSRTVTFEDCELSNDNREATLNGSFTNSVENGGDGFCNADNTIDFAKMVIGRNGEDAVHQHDIDEDGMVFTFSNAHGNDVTLTKTGSRTVTYTNPVDDDEDGTAESVTATVEKNISRVRTIDGSTAHSINVFTTEVAFNSEDEEANVTTIEPTFPVHNLTFDSDTGKVSARTIASGDLIIDHNLAKIRMVFGVGDDGLNFDDGTTCGPVSGTMTMIGYTINDDGSIGAEVGTGTVVFEDGEVETATFEGVVLNPRPRPCE